MKQITDLITALHQSHKLNLYLLTRVEDELKRLATFVNPNSNTASAFDRPSTFAELAKAARADSAAYGAGVYKAIEALVSAAHKALMRWSENKSSGKSLALSLKIDSSVSVSNSAEV